MSRREPTPNLLRGLCFAFLVAGALSLAAGLALPLVMSEIRGVPRELIEDVPQATVLDADLSPPAADVRQIETRKAVVEVNDRRADGTFYNPPHPGTGAPAVSVRRVFTSADGLEYSGAGLEIRKGKAESRNQKAD
jgi:hypothetical protein